jgi:hypothetical protein
MSVAIKREPISEVPKSAAAVGSSARGDRPEGKGGCRAGLVFSPPAGGRRRSQ